MTTYTTIANGAIDQDSPVTQTLMQALRDNPIAITEGASGAPRVNYAALDMYITEGTASRSTSGTSNIVTVTGLDDLGYILVNSDIATSTSDSINLTLRYETSTDNGSSFASAITFASFVQVDQIYSAIIDCTGTVNAVRISMIVSETGTSSASVTSQIFGFGVE